ncbi:sugar transferase [Adhaeribacter soli]|uniref:Sugar transferase n=1 Tax=Adhaeribacter soli TaxID=2607655 RepID=A0A5N1IUF5_9BACT|nr:sugar transferase [Adhaeribacter soli]KAA9333835.1 sugar transferase [Adhaeribacter soli]
MYRKFFKPLLDYCLAGIFLIPALPLLLVLFPVLFFQTKGKPLFRQVRPGYKGRLFTIYKFRTMNEARDEKGNLLPDAERLTGFGKFVRKTSLDELPQLFNVLKGDLSLVGPRPLLVEYLELYTPEQFRRHEVKPGITGWAQVNGRNAVTWERRFELDLWYVNHLSFGLDLKILGLTFLKLFRHHEVSAPGHVTMERFTGSSGRQESEIKP